MTAPSKAAPAAPKAASAETRKAEREPLLVDAGFQMRSLLSLVTFALLQAALVLLVFFLPLSRSVAAESDMRLRILLQAQLAQVHFHLWPLMLVAGLVAGYVGFYHSLRAARPVHRTHYALNAIAAGETPLLRIGRQEEFRFLEDNVALLNQKMKLITTRNRDILLNLEAHIKRMTDRLAADEVIARSDLEEFIAALRAQLDKAPEVSLGGRA